LTRRLRESLASVSIDPCIPRRVSAPERGSHKDPDAAPTAAACRWQDPVFDVFSIVMMFAPLSFAA